MREIEFRGKNSKDEWVYGSLIINETENEKGKFQVAFIVPGLPCASDGGDFYTARMERVKIETIGQYTGLHDNKGNEIYEGDIIKSTDYPFMDEGKTNYLGIVSCDTYDAIGNFYVMLYVTKESERRGISNFTNKSFYDLQMENVEVVGNIFDNKGMFRDSDDVIMLWYLED